MQTRFWLMVALLGQFACRPPVQADNVASGAPSGHESRVRSEPDAGGVLDELTPSAPDAGMIWTADAQPDVPAAPATTPTTVEPENITVYASPQGTGTSCSEQEPCTVQQAKSDVEAMTGAATGDIFVELAGGMYRLAEPLRFTSADSGKNGHSIMWRAGPGAHPVLSGAIRVTNWTLTDSDKNIWRAVVPSTLLTRQLYVDGARAPIAQGAPPVSLTASGDGYVAADDTYANWRNPSALEFVYPGGAGEWTEPRCRVGSAKGTQISMSQPCWNNTTNRPHLPSPAVEFPSMSVSTLPSRIENAYELMQPGQWYLDTTESSLYFRSAVNLDPNQSQVEAPVLEQLLVGDGTLDDPVHDISFSGLEFAYATWNAPSTAVGFAEIQANITITGGTGDPPQGTCNLSSPGGTCPFGAYSREPGNLSWRAAENVKFVRNKFRHLGASALVFEYGSRSNLIEGNLFTDISGSAIQLGDTTDPHPADVGESEREISTHNEIDNNIITDIGVEYHGAIGIMLFFTQHSSIRNNEIRDVPYTGISSGALAGHADTPTFPDTTTNVNADNEISNNVIYHYMTALNDGGAIYVEGHQNETRLTPDGGIDEVSSYDDGLRASGNVVFDQGGAGNAYYDDIGSQWITWMGNVQWQASNAQGGCVPVGHLRFVGNYQSDPIASFGCGTPLDTSYQNNAVIPRLPTAADLPVAILGAAGLEPAFRDVSAALAPQLEYANPSTGTALANARVLIAGAGFGADTQVSWDDRAAAAVDIVSSNFIVAEAPAGADFSLLRVTNTTGLVHLRINDTDGAIIYTGAWTAARYPGNYSDDTQHVTEQDGDSFSFIFAGVGIDFMTADDSNRGGADVYIDDKIVQHVSCFSPTLLFQQVCARISGLDDGPHNLKVVKTSGTYLTLDALQIVTQPIKL